MTINEYKQRAMATLNPKLTERDVLINSVMGLCGESGEAIDIVKKWLAQGHPLDREHLAKELGDVAWSLAEAATALDLDLEDILRANRFYIFLVVVYNLCHFSLAVIHWHIFNQFFWLMNLCLFFKLSLDILDRLLRQR